jgi:hypothetical protein
MDQSTQSYEQRSQESTDSEPQPACCASGIGQQEWRETEYTDALSAFYAPCGYPACFPRGEIDLAVGEDVVLSRNHPSSFHRPAGAPAAEPSAIAADGGSEPDPFADCERVAVSTITDFREDDGVTWEGLTSPLTVSESSADVSGVLTLRGPSDGEYVLEERPPASWAIYPGYGIVDELERLTLR